MPTTFENAIETVLAHEGTLSEHRHDPGGVTKWGISLRWLRSQGKLGDVDLDGDIDADDVRALTRQQAIDRYRMGFWKPAYEQLPQELANKVFDFAVNASHAAAHRTLQRALQNLVVGPLLVDGVIGPRTLAALGGVEEAALLREFRAAQAFYYCTLCFEKPELRKFIRGWLRRAAA